MNQAPDPIVAAPGLEPPVGDTPPPLRTGQLTDGWRWMLGIGWAMVAPALMALGDAAHSLGKPTWWLDDAGTVTWRTVLAFLPIIAAAAAATFNSVWWPAAGALGVATLALSALADSGRSPGVSGAEAVLAAAGLALTVAAFAGRVRVRQD